MLRSLGEREFSPLLAQERPDAGVAFGLSAKALPLHEIAAALKRHQLPVAPSEDAGDYVCNLLFYRLMAHVEATGAPRVAGFIHVPYLDVQLAHLAHAGMQTSHLKSMSERQLMHGVRAILTVVAEALAPQQTAAAR